MLGELVADGVHRLIQIDRHHPGRQLLFLRLGQEPGGVSLELFEKDAVGGDAPECLAVG